MSDETEVIKVSPLIPTLRGVQLEIGGAPLMVDLRFDMLANYKIAKESRKMGDDYDSYMTVAVTLKNFIWPRSHKLTVEQILEGISHDQMIYLNAKIAELLKLNNVELPESGDPTNGQAAALTTLPTSSGGSLKLAPASASDSASPSSGTQGQPS